MSSGKTEPIGSLLFGPLRVFQVFRSNSEVDSESISAVLSKALVGQCPTETAVVLSNVDNKHWESTRYSSSSSAQDHVHRDQSAYVDGGWQSSDRALVAALVHQIRTFATEAGVTSVLVDAGGCVHSQILNTSAVDLFRCLRLPVVLAVDLGCGGISPPISAFESLHIRGYDVEGVAAVCDVSNEHAVMYDELRGFFGTYDIPVLLLRSSPEQAQIVASNTNRTLTKSYPLTSQQSTMEEFVARLSSQHAARLQRLETMATRACVNLWYPFTQHSSISPQSITTIDSAYGDYFQTYRPKSLLHSLPVPDGPNQNLQNSQNLTHLMTTFDGSASWWTQGLGHGNPQLSLAAAYSAGRYGHVMFAGTVHEPSLALAENLIKNLGNPLLQRVFYSDDGSTATEVAVKMALKAACLRYGWDSSKDDIGVLGLKGSYHGDTIGAMDCSEPSTFNQKVEWYRGRGFWLDYPVVIQKKGIWIVETPSGFEHVFGPSNRFSSLNEVFDLNSRERSEKTKLYENYVVDTVRRVIEEGKKLGLLMIEPIVLGAGGMRLVDPLFQRTLVQVVRANVHLFGSGTNIPAKNGRDSNSRLSWTGLPVVFDEVFSGLYRLGRITASSFLGVHPDISVHAKLLTGGLVPLSVTLASESIFESFLSSEKRDALLHGHSYTAHAVGCTVAGESLKIMLGLERNGFWRKHVQDWLPPSTGEGVSSRDSPYSYVWSVWSKGFVHDLSSGGQIDGVWALGSVLSISLQDDEAGYASNAAVALREALTTGPNSWNIHSRVLGNVFYIMASQVSRPTDLENIEELIRTILL